MKYTATLLYICSLLTWGGCNQPTPSKEEPIKVMSFNIRLDAPSDGVNNWKFRKENISQMLKYYSPDLLGMQEVCHNQMEDLKTVLPEYTPIGVGRDDGKEAGEYSPIFFRSNRFTMLDQGNFSLSEHPDTFGIKGWDASYNRIATWVILEDKKNRQQFLYINTHLDNDGEIARKEGIRLIANKIKSIAPNLPAILTGDFNCGPHDEPLSILEENQMINAMQKATICYGPRETFHDFGRLSKEQQLLLDYIYTSNNCRTERFRVIQDTPDDGYLSDHNPIIANIIIK